MTTKVETTENTPKPEIKLYGEDCGICEKTGGTHVYFSHFSRYAHPSCIDAIRAAEEPIMEVARRYFESEKDHAKMNLCHADVITAVKNKIKPLAIKDFVDASGIEALKKIFECEGVTALQEFCSKCD